MKKLAPLLLLCNMVFAQSPTQQKSTPFDKFINKPGIEWAAYINDTARFEKVNLNNILFSRLSKNEIKASLPIGSGSAETEQIKFLKKKEIDRVKFRGNEVAVFDSLGNMTGVKTVLPDLDTATLTLADITQILYLEQGQLKTYVAWVSPMLPVITSSGISLGYGDYFSTCFNYRYNYVSPQKNKVTWLVNTTRRISLDSFDTRNKLKELYGRNLAESLWPHVLNANIAAYDLKTNKRLKASDLTTELINEEKIVVPVYDSLGNTIGSTVRNFELTPNLFTALSLVEDWYYDAAANIVFTRIKELYLHARKRYADEEPHDAEPVLKLVFQ